MNKIRYNKTARNWHEALPLGNGFSGVMVYGSNYRERLCFNDATLWSGYPKDYNNPQSLENLQKVRELIFDGKNAEAGALCESTMTGEYSEGYLPLGDILLDFKNTDRDIAFRTLDLSNAVHTVEANGSLSEIFCSYKDKITAYKITAQKSFDVKIKAFCKLKSRVNAKDNTLILSGRAPDFVEPNYHRSSLFPVKYNQKKGMAFCLSAQAYTDGALKMHKGFITVENATTLTVYFASATGFNGFDKMPSTDENEVISKCLAHLNSVDKDFEKLKARHIDDYSNIYSRQSICFNSDISTQTDKLITAVKNGEDEVALCELLYNFGKYLIISGSRIGTQPLNLQGIWNKSVRPPWSSNYTVNINTQMNYWGASRSGLWECIEPLIQMVYECLTTGAKTAEINYGCRGFSCSHNIDLWRKSTPVKGNACYMYAPLCGVWLANEIYAHYKNGFLNAYEDKVREIADEAARFLNDYLVLRDGFYVVCPSTSPENSFRKDGKVCTLDYASAFDTALARQSFLNALEISHDSKLKENIKEKLSLLYPFKCGKNGILEWHDDYETPENGHRHFSPLYAFYPSSLIGYYGDEEKREWIRSLFKYRLENSSQHIGWSAAWAICLSARLRDGKTARDVILSLLKNAVFTNLFCVHPPNYFQIDGNLGFIAGINEMLLTVEENKITLLPALPENMARSGCVKNMAVNGALISFSWQNGEVAEISSDKPVEIYKFNISQDVRLSNTVTLI